MSMTMLSLTRHDAPPEPGTYLFWGGVRGWRVGEFSQAFIDGVTEGTIICGAAPYYGPIPDATSEGPYLDILRPVVQDKRRGKRNDDI